MSVSLLNLQFQRLRSHFGYFNTVHFLFRCSQLSIWCRIMSEFFVCMFLIYIIRSFVCFIFGLSSVLLFFFFYYWYVGALSISYPTFYLIRPIFTKSIHRTIKVVIQVQYIWNGGILECPSTLKNNGKIHSDVKKTPTRLQIGMNQPLWNSSLGKPSEC